MKNIKSIKSINLDEMERPRTMVIVHYKNKRLSIPLFHQCFNFTQYINAQIYKFQQTILKTYQQSNIIKNTGNKQTVTKQQQLNNIVCYKMHNHETNQLTKLKTNILMSVIRDLTQQKINYHFDITEIFNYLEIQPYYGQNIAIINSQNHSIYAYQVLSILAKTIDRNVYLAMRKIDGIYACIKVKRKNDKLKNIFSDGISIHKVNEELAYQLTTFLQRYEQFESNQYCISIVEYCPGGTLLQYWSQQGKKPLSQQQCLIYLKQLLLAAYNLHKYYGVIHRQIMIEKIYVGLKGELKLNQFNSMSTPRIIKPNTYKQYNQFKQVSNKSAYYYFQEQQIQSEIYSIGPCTPPQLLNQRSQYNSLVDYYNIGLVIYQLLNGRPYTPRDYIKNQRLDEMSLNIVLSALLSHDLTIRGNIVAELLFSLFESDHQPNYQKLINLSAIQVGNIAWKDQSQYHNKHYNNDMITYYQLLGLVDHSKDQDIGNNYLNPVFKQKKKVSKEKLKKTSNSQNKVSKKKSDIYKKFDDSLSKSKNSKHSKKSKNSNGKSKSKSQSQNKYLQPKQSKINIPNKAATKSNFYPSSINQIHQSDSNHLNGKNKSSHLSPKQNHVMKTIVSQQINHKSPNKFKQTMIGIAGTINNREHHFQHHVQQLRYQYN